MRSLTGQGGRSRSPLARAVSNGIYFDYAATTPLDPAVRRAMAPYFGGLPSANSGGGGFGNPGSLHAFGQEAMGTVDSAREKIGRILGLDVLKGFREIIFTGSATEANNLALRAIFNSARLNSRGTGRLSTPAAESGLDSRPADSLRQQAERNQAQRDSETFRSKLSKPIRIIVSAIEHESILETARALEKEGAELVILPVDKNGIVDLEFLKKNLAENTVLVSVMYANNETGVIQPIAEISKIISAFKERNFVSKKSVSEPERAWSRAKLEERGRESSGRASGWASETPSFRETRLSEWPLFHIDAVQAFQYLDCSPEKLGADLLTLSAHKICGPKGVGALYIRSGIFDRPLPIIAGGGQEFGWRSGTENTPLIAGFGQAAEMAAAMREKEKIRVAGLRDYFGRELKKIFPKAVLNNDFVKRKNDFLPNILNIYFSGFSAEDLLIRLDMAGVAVSAGSACSARVAKISHVLQTMGLPEKRIKSSLRFSFGRFTDRSEIKEALGRIKKIL